MDSDLRDLAAEGDRAALLLEVGQGIHSLDATAPDRVERLTAYLEGPDTTPVAYLLVRDNEVATCLVPEFDAMEEAEQYLISALAQCAREMQRDGWVTGPVRGIDDDWFAFTHNGTADAAWVAALRGLAAALARRPPSK